MRTENDKIIIMGLEATNARLKREGDYMQQLCNRWIYAAEYVTPFGLTLGFSPTTPEAFAESRRHEVDRLLSKGDAANSELTELRATNKELERKITELESRNNALIDEIRHM